MKIFMAGGVSGNLKPFWKEACQQMAEGKAFTNATEDSMRIFLAGGGIKTVDTRCPSRASKKKREMQIYLAGQNGMHRIISEQMEDKCKYSSPELHHGEIRGGV